MKSIFTYSLFTFFALTTALQAQVESVSVGPAYAYQAYYDLSSGEVTQVENEAWDIAFTNFGQIDAGILINESITYGAEGLSVYLASESDWAAPITDIDQFNEATILLNVEDNWTEGAFNTVKDPSSPFDYGWGSYNTSNHSIEGDKIFVIKLRDGSYLKFQVESLIGGTYTFRYANLDGSDEVTDTVSKESSAKLIHYSFSSQDIVEVPQDYDLVFQRYSVPLDAGGGEFIDYTVTGVLLAPGVSAVVADGVDVENVNESDYAGQYSDTIDVIGHEWKSYDFSLGWIMDEDRVQFVKTQEGEIYKITFYDFEGSTTGTTTLSKEYIGAVATKDVLLKELNVSVYPNPTTDYIICNADEQMVRTIIYDAEGRSVLDVPFNNRVEHIDVSHLSVGIYHIVLLSDTAIATERIVVTK